ncbi:MAG: hypothetical protein AB1758_15975 [Candidatus Eremiobacterota bacterium]
MIIQQNAIAPQPGYRRALAAASDPDPKDSSEVGRSGGLSGRKVGAAAAGLAGGAVVGLIASKLVASTVAPFVGIGFGALVAWGGIKIKGHKLSDLMSPFKPDAEDSPSTASKKKMGNLAVRIGAGVVAGALAASLASWGIVLACTVGGAAAGLAMAKD